MKGNGNKWMDDEGNGGRIGKETRKKMLMIFV
jgi:hypothetical protein